MQILPNYGIKTVDPNDNAKDAIDVIFDFNWEIIDTQLKLNEDSVASVLANENNRIIAEDNRVTEFNVIKTESETATNNAINTTTEANNAINDTIEATALANNAINTIDTTNNNMKIWEVFNPSKIYFPLNKISLNGNSYVCILQTVAGIYPNPDADTVNWVQIAKHGADGLSSIVNSSFTCTNIGSHAIHGLTMYPNSDLQVFYKGLMLNENIDYTKNIDGLSIDTLGFNFEIGDIVKFKLYQGYTESSIEALISDAIAKKSALENRISLANTANTNLTNTIATANTTTYATKGEINTANSNITINSNKIGDLSQNGLSENNLALAIKNDRSQLAENTNKIKSILADVKKEFGAIGDGVTDDTIALQTAFDSDYDLFFPVGTYYTTAKLTLTKSKQIIGKNGSIILKNSALSTPIIEILSSDVLIEGLELKGNKPWYARTDDNTDTINYNNYWNNRTTGGYGFLISHTDKVVIRRCKVSYVTMGILTQFSSNVLIENCYIHHTMADAFPIYHGSKNITIRKNIAEYNGDDAFPVYASLDQTTEVCKNILIENNISSYCGARAFLCHGGENVMFAYNTSYYPKLSSLCIEGNDLPGTYNVKDVVNCKAIGNTFYVKNIILTSKHIWIINASDVLLQGNTLIYDDVAVATLNTFILLTNVKQSIVVNNYFQGGGLQIGLCEFMKIINNRFKSCVEKVARLYDSSHVEFIGNNSDGSGVIAPIISLGTNGTPVKGITVLDNNLDKGTGTIDVFGVDGLIINANQLATYSGTVVKTKPRGILKGTVFPSVTVFDDGTMFYNTANTSMCFNNGTTWKTITST